MTEGADLALPAVAEAWLPRILTQVCRDPTSPLYGCADRNWWHYKIRDFPSIILQQAGYALHLATRLPEHAADEAALDALAAASARFWNTRALKHGAFEEYYPYEQGYPPLAFATLAVAKLAGDGAVPLADVAPGLRIARKQLRARFEPQAANQQVAGLAALAWIDRVLPQEADPATFAALKARTLALQSGEGWYWEYDGPDLGYLAVTIDCLWDLYDATGDAQFRTSIDAALGFMDRVFTALPSGLGMLNARNTDYLAPYGIVRAALAGNAGAARVAQAAFGTADAPDHAFAAVDDRYLCHYLGQSVVRAVVALDPRDLPAPVAADATTHWLTECGYLLAPGLVVAARKGGVLTLAGTGSEFGWMVERGKRQFVSHWWSREWQVSHEGGAVTISGELFAHSERLSTPPKHVVLRGLSFVLGKSLIALLKRALIFKRGGGGPGFERTVTPVEGGVEIVDRFAGLLPTDRLIRAPRASKRHVASADSFHGEDLGLAPVVEVSRQTLPDGRLEIRSRISRA